MKFESKGPQWFHKIKTLFIQDEKKSHSFVLNDDWSNIASFYGDSPVFKKAVGFRSDRPDLFHDASLKSNGSVEQFTLKTLTGEILSLAINANTTLDPLSIKIVSGKAVDRYPLFYAETMKPSM